MPAEVFLRENTPTERRVLAVFLHHARLSCRQIEPFVNRSHEIRQWFYRLKHLFEHGRRDGQAVAVDETKVKVDSKEAYVWAAIDRLLISTGSRGISRPIES